jgi:predicted metal-dependent hydrolase
MTEAIRIGEPAIEIRLRRHAGARRMVLRIGRALEGAVLTLPLSTPVARAHAFALDQEAWLRLQLAAAPPRRAVRLGSQAPFRGAMIQIEAASDEQLALSDGVLRVPGPEGMVPARVAAFLREAARARCLAAVQRHSAQIGLPFGRITLRDTRGRWGSCASTGNLMFSWRLIMAPDAVLDYVAAHEIAHLAEMNHSARFWAQVARLRPDYPAARDWLRRHGPDLMAYDFTGAG